MINFSGIHRTAQARRPERVVTRSTPASDPLLIEEIPLVDDARQRVDPVLNRFLGYALVVFVWCVPIPMASNRPVWSMIEATMLGVLAVFYYGVVWLRGRSAFVRLSDYRMPALFMCGILLGAGGQLLPLGIGDDPVFSALPAEMVPQSISVDRGATLVAIVRLLSFAVFFALSAEAASSAGRVKRLAWLVYWGIFAHAVWGGVATYILQDAVLWGEKFAYLGVPTGTFVNRNSFATFLGMGGCVGAALMLNHSRGRTTRPLGGGRRVISDRGLELAAIGLSMMLIIAVLVATQSRMGLVAMLCGGAVVCGLFLSKMVVPARVMWACCAIVVVTALGVFGSGIAESFLFSGQSAMTRFSLYAQIVDAIGHRPLVGYGLDAFPTFYEVAMRPPVPGYYVWDKAHSTYLALWLELGVVVGTLPMLILGWCILRAIKSARRRVSAFAVPIASVGVVVVAAVHSTIDFSLEIPANVFVVLFLCALGSAQFRKGAGQ